jgi:hypothetical protein
MKNRVSNNVGGVKHFRAHYRMHSENIHKRNLLEGRVVIASYSHHVRLLSPEPFGWFAPPKHSGLGADIVMESITLIDPDLAFGRIFAQ